MNNILFGNKTNGEKVLQVILMLMSVTLFMAVPVGLAWIISLFGVNVNYFIFAGIGLFIYVFGVVMTFLKLKQFTRVAKNMENEFNKF
ncbi:MAG: hypothetical protein LPK26_04790 [Bacillaceae bacterium]|nr:hypothetical protein [Bacillaceae bacterium]